MTFADAIRYLANTATAPLAVPSGEIRKDALRIVHNAIFRTGKLPPEELRKIGIYIGGFLYFYHQERKVDYKFFEKSDIIPDGSRSPFEDLGYMFPYIGSVQFEALWAGKNPPWDYYIDSLFRAHRENQKNKIWLTDVDGFQSLNPDGSQDYLVPEYLAKAPSFFIDGAADALPPFLLIPFKELAARAINYRKVLGRIAKEPPDGFANEWLLWQSLKEHQDNLTEFERWLINNRILQHPDHWKTFFSAVEHPIVTLNELASGYPAGPAGMTEIESIRDLHTACRFPVLPYLYWNAIDKQPKTHLVLPVWVDLLNEGAECLRQQPETQRFEVGKTRLTGAAVVTIRPDESRQSEDEAGPLDTAILLSRFVSFPQIAASYYEDVEGHQKQRMLAARRAAIAAIAAQTLSHNIGSHALSDAKLFQAGPINDINRAAVEDDLKGLKVFHQYLQARMDYIAQLIADTPPQPEPMYLFADILCEFFRQRLLLNRLVADRGFEGAKLSFRLIYPKGGNDEFVVKLSFKEAIEAFSKGAPISLGGDDVLVAIPGGAVGRHALYSILENMMRNSAKYGRKCELSGKRPETLEVTMRLRSPGADKDYWLLELSDNLSGFTVDDEAPKGAVDSSGHERISDGVYVQLCGSFGLGVIDNKGNPRAGGHGLTEIKEAMRFLHPHEGSECHPDDTGRRSPWACGIACRKARDASAGLSRSRCCNASLSNEWIPCDNGERNDGGTLVYRVRLRRPRLLGVWAPNSGIIDGQYESAAHGVYFRESLIDDVVSQPNEPAVPSLAELSPHLLLIVDPDDASEAEVMNALAKEHWRLPFRLAVLTRDPVRTKVWVEAIQDYCAKAPTRTPEGITNKGTPFLPIDRVRVIDNPQLFVRLSNPETSRDSKVLFAVINDAYDAWLRVYKPTPDTGPWHLLLSLQRGDEVKEHWKDAKSFKSAATTLSIYSSASDSEPVLTHIFGPELNAKDFPPCKVVHFGNHGSVPKEFESALRAKTLAYTQRFGAVEAPRLFNALYTPPSGKDALKFFVLSLLEAALTEVAVFDERTLEALFEPGGRKTLSATRVIDSRDVKIGILTHIPSLKRTEPSLARSDITWPFAYSPSCSNRCFCRASFIDRQIVIEEVCGKVADVFLVHEGLIEELTSKKLFEPGLDLTFLSSFSRIVRMSGKGPTARKLDPRLPFTEYSSIGVSIFPYEKEVKRLLGVEKLALAKALLNSTGQLNPLARDST